MIWFHIVISSVITRNVTCWFVVCDVSLPSSLHHHHHHHPSSVADGGRLSDRVSTRHMSAGRPPTLTRSRSDVTRDRLMSSVDSYSMSRGLHHNMPDAAAAVLSLIHI